MSLSPENAQQTLSGHLLFFVVDCQWLYCRDLSWERKRNMTKKIINVKV